jgi:hypothetical protein
MQALIELDEFAHLPQLVSGSVCVRSPGAHGIDRKERVRLLDRPVI